MRIGLQQLTGQKLSLASGTLHSEQSLHDNTVSLSMSSFSNSYVALAQGNPRAGPV